MIEFEYTIVNPIGLHMRPAGRISKFSNESESSIFMKYNDVEIDTRSMMKILTLGVSHGKKVVFRIIGGDEEKTLQGLKKIIYSVDM